MAVSTKIRWKRYINELRFINEELDFVKEINRAAAREFQTYYEDYCVKNEFDLTELNREHRAKIDKLYPSKSTHQDHQDNPQLDTNTDGSLVIHDASSEQQVNSDNQEEYSQQLSDYQMSKDEQEIHDIFNKVFRKIALLIHPDKLDKSLTTEERDVKLNMFKEARIALEERRYFIILDIAEKFNITTPKNYKQQIRWMKKETDTLARKLTKEKDTYNYIFSECESEAEKDYTVKRFMTQLFGAEVFNK
jgi:regulator of sigma D